MPQRPGRRWLVPLVLTLLMAACTFCWGQSTGEGWRPWYPASTTLVSTTAASGPYYPALHPLVVAALQLLLSLMALLAWTAERE